MHGLCTDAWTQASRVQPSTQGLDPLAPWLGRACQLENCTKGTVSGQARRTHKAPVRWYFRNGDQAHFCLHPLSTAVVHVETSLKRQPLVGNHFLVRLLPPTAGATPNPQIPTSPDLRSRVLLSLRNLFHHLDTILTPSGGIGTAGDAQDSSSTVPPGR